MIQKLFRIAKNVPFAILRTDKQTASMAAHTASMASLLARETIGRLRTEQLRLHPDQLLGNGFKAYSQNDEDGIIQEIFLRIGTTNRTFIEFGCGEGLENNTLYLLLLGWSGVWIDGNPKNIESVNRLHRGALDKNALRAESHMITAENIDDVLSELCEEKQIDLLSIDIDGNDYWVWSALQSINPRVVVVEYNATLRPPVDAVQAYRADTRWNETNYYGASLAALERLGTFKGYALVGCNLNGVNAFFVRQDCLNDRFAPPFTAAHHYMPPNFDLFILSKGETHPPGVGLYMTMDSEKAAASTDNVSPEPSIK